MLLLFILIGLIVLIVILLLPESIVNKLAGVGVAIGIMFTGYGLYLTSQLQKREIFKDDISRVSDVWMKYYKSILSNPDTWPTFDQIHGTSVTVPEHVMFSQVAQIAEEMAIREDIGLVPVDRSWKNTLSKWTSHPKWSRFWQDSKDEYTRPGQNLIESLMVN